jgi:hypothetical protein
MRLIVSSAVIAVASCGSGASAPEPLPPSVAISESPSAPATVVPTSIPPDAPSRVRFGVVLIQYRGAEGVRDPRARSKEEAQRLAEKLYRVARSDFGRAVERGDPGSIPDAGVMYLGILEPTPEAVLFGLPPGGVGGPVDTPRGYWVVKRLAE